MRSVWNEGRRMGGGGAGGKYPGPGTCKGHGKAAAPRFI